jgi:hypothetical protein
MKAALSLDLDNKWSYMKTHGDDGWQSFPSYLDRLIPDALQLLRTFGVKITFFVVGQDAALTYNREALEQITAGGHEVGNHSYHHEPWMHRRSWQEIHDELARSEESIEQATGRVPRGFRGPGFVRSPMLTDVLAARGYLYDASSLPTFIGPLARAYYFRSAKLAERERNDRYDLYGHFADCFQSNRRHRIYSGERTLQEVPVTTMPGLRLPIHVSYVLYIATFSPRLALAYFRTAMLLCRATRTEPSILLHPLDFLSMHDCPELAFFPAMSMDAATKRTVLFQSLSMLVDMFDVMPLERFVAA